MKPIFFLSIILLFLSNFGVVDAGYLTAGPSKGGSWFVYNDVKPGDVISDSIEVTSLLDKKQKVSAYVVDADLRGGGFLPESDDAPRNQVGAWLQFEKPDFVLGPNERRSIPFKLKIPRGVSGKTYVGAIFIKGFLPDSSRPMGSGMQVVIRVGTRVYLTVSGPSVPAFNQKPDVEVTTEPEEPIYVPTPEEEAANAARKTIADAKSKAVADKSATSVPQEVATATSSFIGGGFQDLMERFGLTTESVPLIPVIPAVIILVIILLVIIFK